MGRQAETPLTDDALRHDVINLRKEMTAVMAECYAHQIMLGDLTSALIHDQPDWRQRLDTLRRNAIMSAENFEFMGGETPANEVLRKEIVRRIDEHFSAVLAGLSAWHARRGS